LTSPELNQNILFLIEEITLILSCSIEIIEIPILQGKYCQVLLSPHSLLKGAGWGEGTKIY